MEGEVVRPSGFRGVINGFFEFVHHYGVFPLAIGVVVGTAVNDLVKFIVDGLVSPFIALVTPGATLATYQIEFNGSVFKIGAVVDAFLNFFFVALVVYLVVKLLLRQDIVKKAQA